MNIVEWVGFIVIIIFAGFSVLRALWEIFTGGNPEKGKNDERLRNFLKSLEIEPEEEIRVPPPPPPKHKKVKPPKAAPYKQPPKQALVQDLNYTTRYDRATTYRDAYSIKAVEKLPQGRLLLDKLPTKRDLIIYQVIMNPPKGL